MNVSILFRMKFPGGHATFMLMLQLGFRRIRLCGAHMRLIFGKTVDDRLLVRILIGYGAFFLRRIGESMIRHMEQ